MSAKKIMIIQRIAGVKDFSVSFTHDHLPIMFAKTSETRTNVGFLTFI